MYVVPRQLVNLGLLSAQQNVDSKQASATGMVGQGCIMPL